MLSETRGMLERRKGAGGSWVLVESKGNAHIVGLTDSSGVS